MGNMYISHRILVADIADDVIIGLDLLESTFKLVFDSMDICFMTC